MAVRRQGGKKRNTGGAVGKCLVYLCVFLAGIALNLWYGTQKQGFHEDEIYSYWSSNRTAGIGWPDRDWMATQAMTDELVVLPGEGFRYGLVKTVQSWDVHPPLWYDLLHTACSLKPGVFSKWFGIGVNLAGWGLCFLLLLGIMRTLRMPHRFAACFLALWVLHPLAVSGVLFLRMYEWFTVFVLTCLLLHLRILKKGLTKLRMAAVMIVSCLGFLTHYYYLIYFFFTGVTVSLLWFLQRTADTEAKDLSFRLSRIGRYVLECGLSIGLAVVLYPASLSHILRGYRGKEAAAAFLSVSGWGARLSFFGGLLNEMLFSGLLPVLFFVCFVLVVAAGVEGTPLAFGRKARRKTMPGNTRRQQDGAESAGVPAQTAEKAHFLSQRDWNTLIILLVPAILYFLLVSQTALLLGETSIRYLLPVAPILFLAAAWICYRVLRRLNRSMKPEAMGDEEARSRKYRSARLRWRVLSGALTALIFGLFLFIDLNGLFVESRVLFLYPEEREVIALAQENREEPVVVIYNPETKENIWRLYDKLAAFPEIYYIDAANEAPCLRDSTQPDGGTSDAVTADRESSDDRIDVSRLKDSPTLLVFAADTADNIDRDARIADLMRSNPHLSDKEVLYRRDMWTWYRLGE